MRGVSPIKGVADIRTAISAHYRSASRHEGTPFLEIMAMGMERLRLERDLEWLGKREERIRKRLAEIKPLLEARVSQMQDDDHPGTKATMPGEQSAPGGGPWRTMKVEY